MRPKDIDEIPDETIEKVLRTKGFQKMLAYSQLADSIDVLKEDDELFDSMVNSIRQQHSNVNSEESVREFFELMVQEIESFTEPLVDEEGDEEVQADELAELYTEEEEEPVEA